MLRGTLAIALVALTGSACSVSRQTAVKSEVREMASDKRDSIRVEQVMVAVHDTIVETTTIIVRENEQGDTLRLSKVTERDRVSDRAEVREQQERVVVRKDTVYIERKDSLQVTAYSLKGDSPVSSKQSAVSATLKWIFWIIVGLSALILIVKLKI